MHWKKKPCILHEVAPILKPPIHLKTKNAIVRVAKFLLNNYLFLIKLLTQGTNMLIILYL